MGLVFSNSKDPWYLVTWSLGQVPRGMVVRIVEGKSRVDALLNTDGDSMVFPVLIINRVHLLIHFNTAD